MTPAIKLLERSGTAHKVVAYEHDPSADSYGEEAAEALGLQPSAVFKTLLADVDRGETVVAVVPVAHRLDLKALARAAGAKKASMADPTAAERLTGYVVGGISPLGQKKRLRTFVDSSAVDLDEIHVSGGRRGVEIALAPTALVDLLGATVSHLIADLGVESGADRRPREEKL
ncbi:MAG: Cys-tRNA(Pro) deacylase [Acidimicrobiales bacterium]